MALARARAHGEWKGRAGPCFTMVLLPAALSSWSCGCTVAQPVPLSHWIPAARFLSRKLAHRFLPSHGPPILFLLGPRASSSGATFLVLTTCLARVGGCSTPMAEDSSERGLGLTHLVCHEPSFWYVCYRLPTFSQQPSLGCSSLTRDRGIGSPETEGLGYGHVPGTGRPELRSGGTGSACKGTALGTEQG